MRQVIVSILFAITFACDSKPTGPAVGREVVLYSSIDEPYLRPIVKRFEKETGITVRIVTDTEANKSAGLAERLIAEKDRPQADVFWGNEIFHSINLAEQGVFEPYRPPTARDIPAKWRGAEDLYTCIGLRAQMLVVSTRPEHAQAVDRIRGLGDLVDPGLRSKIAMGHPAFGTTSGHVAALYVLWGEERFTRFFTSLRGNDLKLLGGNGPVVNQVATGTIIAGFTDNDDINHAKAQGLPVESILPDQTDIGTLLIPGTIALIKDAPHANNAQRLIDFLCDPAIERQLIADRFLAYSVRDAGEVKTIDVDYVKVAHAMKKAIELALGILQERK